MSLSLRRTVSVAIAVALVSASCQSGEDPPAAGATVASTPASAPDSSVPATTQLATSDFVSVPVEPLTAAGVTVTSFDDLTVGPGYSVTEWQADNLLRAAANGAGQTGAALRARFPQPEADTVPVDAIIATWLLLAEGPIPDQARALMPEPSMTVLQNATDPVELDRVVYPDAVVMLYVQDGIAAAAGATQGFRNPAGIGAVPSARVDVCSTLLTFYQGAMETVFGLINDAFGATAVEWAQKAIGLIPIPKVIKIPKKADEIGLFQAVGLVIALAGAISPWNVTLVTTPGDEVPYGVDPGHGIEATTRLIVDPGLNIEWPASLKSCAQLVGLELPSLDPVGATVEWDPTYGPHAAETDRFVVVMQDEQGYYSSIKFRTSTESAQQATGAPAKGLIAISAIVKRPGDQTFRGIVEQIVQRVAGNGEIAAVLSSIIGGAVESIDEINGPPPVYAFPNAIFHEAPPETVPPTPSTAPPVPGATAPPASPCVGTTLVSLAGTEMPAGVTLILEPSGRVVFDLNNSSEYINSQGGVEIKIQLKGTITGTWTQSGDVFNSTPSRVDVGGTVDVGGSKVDLTPEELNGMAGMNGGGATGETLLCQPDGSIVIQRTGQTYVPA